MLEKTLHAGAKLVGNAGDTVPPMMKSRIVGTNLLVSHMRLRILENLVHITLSLLLFASEYYEFYETWEVKL